MSKTRRNTNSSINTSGRLNDEEAYKLGQVIKSVSRLKPPSEFKKTLYCPCGYLKEPVAAGFRLRAHPHLQGGKYLDTACRGCHKDLDEKSTVVCTTCKTTVARLDPHVDRKTGFRFERGAIYHVMNCGVCTSDKDPVTGEQNVTAIMEMEAYKNKTR